MRITTQMLNETAKRTGIPVSQTSLLSYINNEGSSGGNTLLDALNKNNKVSSTAANNYKKLEKAAESLKDHAQKLSETGEKSFWEKIKTEENADEARRAVEDFAKYFNSTISGLDKSSGMLDQYYSQRLQEAAGDNSEALEKIGVTIGKDGKLSIDQEKLGEASIEDIQAVFAGSNGLAAKTAYIAERAADNAHAGTQSVSGQYNAAGTLSSQLASRYDFWG